MRRSKHVRGICKILDSLTSQFKLQKNGMYCIISKIKSLRLLTNAILIFRKVFQRSLGITVYCITIRSMTNISNN